MKLYDQRGYTPDFKQKSIKILESIAPFLITKSSITVIKLNQCFSSNFVYRLRGMGLFIELA